MCDNELLKITYEAYGFRVHSMSEAVLYHPDYGYSMQLDQWNPLKDDAQAMALLKRFPVHCIDALDNMIPHGPMEDSDFRHLDINRVIVECVAKKLQPSSNNEDPHG